MVAFPGDYYLDNHVKVTKDYALAVMQDRVRVYRPSEVKVLDERGILVPQGGNEFVVHEGSQIIPCRFDNSRAFRPDALRNQELVVNEHYIHFPIGVDVRPADKIQLLSQESVISNGTFVDGLSGWNSTISGGSQQTANPPGVALTFADVNDRLLEQTSLVALTVNHTIRVRVYIEVQTGTVSIVTPAGTITQAAPFNGQLEVQGVVNPATQGIYLQATAIPATAHVAEINFIVYRDTRIYEAAKIVDASLYDITKEVQATELEFQHTRNYD